MKTESDYYDGQAVAYKDRAGKTHAGTVDFSYGDEQEGHVRVQQFFYETSDIPNTFYVPADKIV